jgi:ribosomal protein S18 acetylase RimI-like enzyme
MLIRPATLEDDDALWSLLEPVIRAGETNALPRDMDRTAALAYWRAPGNEVFVAEEAGQILGTSLIRPNQMGPGAHFANAAYITARHATGRGIARRLCEHSLEAARARGFRAMQFNLVISTNAAAVHLWQSCGFAIVGTLPAAFDHPTRGPVDAYVMHRTL